MKKKLNELKGRKFLSAFCLRRKMSLRHFCFHHRLRKKTRKYSRRIARLRKCNQLRLQNSILQNESLLSLYTRSIRCRTIFTLIVVFGALLIAIPVAATGLPASTLDMFNENDIPYYDPCAGNSGGSNGGGGSGSGASEVEGDDNQAKIWNWFVNADIDGVSDDAMVIAGIMGNIAIESTYDPYIVNPYGCKGLWQVCGASGYLGSFESAVAAGAGSYWGGGAPQSAIDKAISVELDYLTTQSVTHFQNFTGSLNVVTNKSPRSYAELFMVIVENCYGGESTVEDPGVASIAGYPTYQNGEGRRTAAQEIYDKFGKNGAKTTAKTTNNLNIASSNSVYDKSPEKLVASNQKDQIVADVPKAKTGNKNLITKAKNANKQDTDFPKVNYWNDGNNAEMKRLLEAYGDLAYQTGRAYNLPWQAILVQMRYESKDATCGDASGNPVHRPNNFWGIGCPVGAGAGAPAYANLGEGFNAYGEKVHNGNHDQAIGIADPKEYLEKLGPTWVQGRIDGAGYHNIEGMKNSVDALQKYIDSDEGQKIVKNFTNYEGDYMNGSGSDDDCVAGSSSAQIDSEGWITGGIEGLSKESYDVNKLTGCGNNHCEGVVHTAYKTSDGKPQSIILHYTTGGSALTNGAIHLYGGNYFPPHFTVDLKSKKGYQHVAMSVPSYAVATYDGYSVQIEIQGIGYDNWANVDPNSEWNLKNFTDEEWDYLAQYLFAISKYAGIPLESTVQWSNPDQKISVEETISYKGIFGHQHLPGQDGKVDPGNIWDQVKAAIDRAGGGNFCVVNETDVCGNITNTTTQPKSGSVNALQEYVLKYAWKASDPQASSATAKPEYVEAHSKAPYKGGGVTDCGAFVQILIHDSGWDPSFYGVGATGAMLDWLGNPANGWEKITPTDVSQLQPGDVAVNSHHAWVFVGDIPGFGSQFADASLGERVPAATNTGLHYDGETWFRKKGQ